MSGLGQSGSVGRDVARFDPVSLGAVCRSSRGRVRRGVTWSVKAVGLSRDVVSFVTLGHGRAWCVGHG